MKAMQESHSYRYTGSHEQGNTVFHHLQPISNELVGDDEMHVLLIYVQQN